jgi:hypothetical protein
MGFVGDFMVKVLQFPLRFNPTATPGNYTLVLPYKNVAATEGIKSVFNEDYDNAHYQISYINNPRALRVMPFRPEAVNPNMPFMVRDYGGRWKFATNDLGADCSGKPIDNSRGNKGKFIADFQLAVKPEHPEWLEAIFHKVDRGCVEIIPVCEPDAESYAAQDYNSADPVCPSVIQFTAIANDAGAYVIGTTGILCDGNIVTNAGISVATPALLVAALQSAWDTEFGAGQGTWTVVSGTLIQLAGSSCTNVTLEFAI